MKFNLINDPWHQFRSPVIEGGRFYVIRIDPTSSDFTVNFLSPNSKKLEMTLRHDVMHGRVVCVRLSVGGQSWRLPSGGIVDTAEIDGSHLRLAVEMALGDLARAEERIDPTGARTEERAKTLVDEQVTRDKDADDHWVVTRKQSIEAALTEK
jgi:hypothetical protein